MLHQIHRRAAVPYTSSPSTTTAKNSHANNNNNNNYIQGQRQQRQRVSSFDISLIPTNSIRKRELHAFSVHYSMATSSWIATIARGSDPTNPGSSSNNEDGEKRRVTSFQFPTEREARKFAKVYTPPKMTTNANNCVCCSVPFTDGPNNNYTNSAIIGGGNNKNQQCKSFHCKNCGSQICEKCSHRWGIRMLPKTYVSGATSLTVRVCKACDWLSNAFCMSLLQGQYDNALLLHETGNLNLRCTFADIHKEAM
jgi:hypothetical protein